jgi:hypothetical protein
VRSWGDHVVLDVFLKALDKKGWWCMGLLIPLWMFGLVVQKFLKYQMISSLKI